jgi:hypothetical protein
MVNMLSYHLKFLNYVILYTPLDTTKSNMDHEMERIIFHVTKGSILVYMPIDIHAIGWEIERLVYRKPHASCTFIYKIFT